MIVGALTINRAAGFAFRDCHGGGTRAASIGRRRRIHPTPFLSEFGRSVVTTICSIVRIVLVVMCPRGTG